MQPTELCRICGGTGLFLQIFDPEFKYFDDIETCLSVQVKRNDALSQVVCHKCVGTLSWCTEFVEKVNHVKNGRFEPTSKLCLSCRTADGPLFPLPKPSGEKLQDFFSLNTQKNKNLKICHRCQFSLDSISDLREKANTAQQLSRRGQHLQFQVLRKSPSVEDLLSSLKSRDIEVDLGTRSNRSMRGTKSPSSPAGSQGSPRPKHQNGILNSPSVENSKPVRRSATRNSKNSETDIPVVSLNVESPSSVQKSEEKRKPNSRGPKSKILKATAVKSTNHEDSLSDKMAVDQNLSDRNGEKDTAVSCTSNRRADKRKRSLDKPSDTSGSVPVNSGVAVRSRRTSKEEKEKAVNNVADEPISKSSNGNPKKGDGQQAKKLKDSKITVSTPSPVTSTKSKRQRLSKPDESEKMDYASDDSNMALSVLVETPKSLRSRKKSDKPTGDNTENNIPDLKRPAKVVESSDPPQSSSKRTFVKRISGPPKKEQLPQVTATKASKRKSSEIDSAGASAGKSRKQKVELESSSEVEAPSRRRTVKKVNIVLPDIPFTCGVCSKDFTSTTIGKDHELQHDNRYNSFAIRLHRVDLSKTANSLKRKDDSNGMSEECDDDLWDAKSTKPEETSATDFDILLKENSKNESKSSLNTRSLKKPTDSKEAEEQAESSESQPKNTESENAEPKPAESENAEPKPAESENAEPKPAESENADPKPAESENADPKPAESENADPKPAESENADPKPTDSEIADLDSVIESDDKGEVTDKEKDGDEGNDNNREKDEDEERGQEPVESKGSESTDTGHRDPETQDSESKPEAGPDKEELKNSEEQDSEQDSRQDKEETSDVRESEETRTEEPTENSSAHVDLESKENSPEPELPPVSVDSAVASSNPEPDTETAAAGEKPKNLKSALSSIADEWDEEPLNDDAPSSPILDQKVPSGAAETEHAVSKPGLTEDGGVEGSDKTETEISDAPASKEVVQNGDCDGPSVESGETASSDPQVL